MRTGGRDTIRTPASFMKVRKMMDTRTKTKAIELENLYKRNSDCPCLGCNRGWVAGRHSSCHDFCAAFKDWSN